MGRQKKKRGPLSDSEKLLILQRMSEGKSFVEMSEELDRPQNTISKHAKLLREQAILATNQTARSDATLEATVISIDSASEKSEEVKGVMLKLMLEHELDEREAKARINKCLANARKNEVEKVSSKDLYEAAVKTVSSSALFIAQSAEKKQGVAVMSVAGSEAGDEVKKMKRPNVLDKNINNKTVFKV